MAMSSQDVLNQLNLDEEDDDFFDKGSDLDVSQEWSSGDTDSDEIPASSGSEDSNDDHQPGPSRSTGRPVRGGTRTPRGSRVNLGRGARAARGRGARAARGRGARAARGRGARAARGRGGAVPPPGWSATSPQPDIPPYTETSGPKCNIGFDAPELDFVLCLVGGEFFESLARNTNKNATSKAPPAPPYPASEYATSDQHWSPTTAAEMKAYVAINILMGIKQAPEYTDYWSEDAVLNDPYVSSLMPRRRYEKLCQYFHCSDPTAPANNDVDRINKVRNFVTELQKNFQATYTPGKCISIDEAMIKYNGRLLWKQYMPKKPTKWGIKLWFLCDSVTGYCLNFEVYTGRGNNPDAVHEFGLGYYVVMALLRNYLLRYHHVYADNFFSSLSLIQDLCDADTFFCGTLRKNRLGIPREIQAVKLEKYESVKWCKEGTSIMVTHWRDKRHVYLISSNNDGQDTMKPRTKYYNQELIPVPTAVTDYNANMGGVDHSDQLRAYYNVGRTGRKWWKYLFWGLFNQSVVNAYILWELSNRPHGNNKRKFSLKTFKLAVIHQLADGYSSRKRKSSSDEQRPVEQVLDSNSVPGHPLVQYGDRKRTCVCCKRAGRLTNGGNRIQTVYGCTGCRANMCKLQCFNEWHNLLPEQ